MALGIGDLSQPGVDLGIARFPIRRIDAPLL
jgi:hypothetical protein